MDNTQDRVPSKAPLKMDGSSLHQSTLEIYFNRELTNTEHNYIISMILVAEHLLAIASGHPIDDE